MVFEDRIDAARQLATALGKFRGKNPLVLAIPRGAVPMGRLLAKELEGELDVVLVRKLGAPGNPEFAVGAVDEAGWTYIAEWAAEVGATNGYLAEETATQLATMRARRAMYTPARLPIDPAGRIVIVIDDGLATGATMMAALHSVRARHPARLVCAVPVASPESLEKIRPHADEVVCLDAPPFFHAVGQFYRTFGQVEDREVVAALAGR
ncbi:MAG: phosphoribosyltransferase [Betaproteobacteria bacterium]|nr:phosphoribosyltransferase [Betaproteobacteria bacterium]PWB60190.1 MAG: phosphoribosyl transferase [Betaproteobacteria bacterium]